MEEYVIIQPVVNLRRLPVRGTATYAHDDLQVSQLLFNEKVRIKDRAKGWVLVEAVEQETYGNTGQWEGYAGWVEESVLEPASRRSNTGTWTVISPFAPVFLNPDEEGPLLFDLSIGTRIPVDPSRARGGRFYPMDAGQGRSGWVDARCFRTGESVADEENRQAYILTTAGLFLGTPYLWGGRSMHMPHVRSIATGVDCSGLINLVFRALGVDLPRDAHEQRMKVEPIPADSAKPGDLIFITPSSGKTNHVMLFAGGERFIEAVESGTEVRFDTFGERFGVRLRDLSVPHRESKALTITFGRAPW